MTLADFVGADLGTRVISYADRDVILYALAVGADAGDLALVFERDLKVLPTFALTLGLWTADAASAAGVFVPERSLHGSQQLTIHRPLPTEGRFEVTGRLAGVWDKGRSAIVDVVAESEYFTASYAIFLPGQGGFGGEPGPGAPAVRDESPTWVADVPTSRDQAVLYRLTGDRHLIHVDPVAARAAGFSRPILHGLCTLGVAARALAGAADAPPWELRTVSARFSAPVLPGATLRLAAGGPAEALSFAAEADGATVLSAGCASFG